MSAYGDITISGPHTAFGEISVAEPTPKVQLQFQYNINSDLVDSRANGGTVSVENRMLKLSTGAGANQSAQIFSRVPVKYGPGQGALSRFTAVFTTGAANSTQYIGIGSIGDGYFFGYTGTAFGVMRRQGGVPKVETFTVTVKSNTAENITITLDGDTATDVTVSNGADTTITANEIAAHDYSGVGDGWSAHSLGALVVFESWSNGAKTGTFSLSSASEAVATVDETLAGVTATDTVVAEASWSEGALPFTLDPTKGNVFQIKYQWLGFGAIEFSIENPATGGYLLVHRIKYANANTVPSIDNPTLPLCALVANTSNTSDIILRSGSMAGFIEGRDSDIGITHGATVEFTGVGVTEVPLITIHNHTVYQGVLNRVNVEVLAISVSAEGTKPSIYRLRKNATLTAASFSNFDADVSPVTIDTTATAVTNGVLEFANGLAKIDSDKVDLKPIELEMEVGEFYTLTLEATNAASIEGTATIVWKEHF